MCASSAWLCAPLTLLDVVSKFLYRAVGLRDVRRLQLVHRDRHRAVKQGVGGVDRRDLGGQETKGLG